MLTLWTDSRLIVPIGIFNKKSRQYNRKTFCVVFVKFYKSPQTAPSKEHTPYCQISAFTTRRTLKYSNDFPPFCIGKQLRDFFLNGFGFPRARNLNLK